MLEGTVFAGLTMGQPDILLICCPPQKCLPSGFSLNSIPNPRVQVRIWGEEGAASCPSVSGAESTGQ